MSKGVYDLLTDIAERCSVGNEKVLKKSKELIALLNSKQSLSCSDTCKAVVCLELASSLTSTPLIREEAVKYSGCKRKIYTNIYNNISKLLNLDKIYSVKEICLLMGVIDVQEPAMKLLEKYKKICKESVNDFEHPMYPCAAVFTYCRSKKIKVNLTKLVEISRVKKMELVKLAEKFESLVETKVNGRNKQKKISASEHDKAHKLEGIEITPRKRKKVSGIMTDEEYEEWKRKMLEE